MPGISIHVVDVSRGLVANGLRVEVSRVAPNRELIAAGSINDRGVLDDSKLAGRLAPGTFEVRFHIADYYRSIGLALPDPPFLDISPYVFGLADSAAHYHLPFKMTPWGYSCFRGGA